MKSKFEIVDDKKAGLFGDSDIFFTSTGQRQALKAINNVLEDKLDLLLLAGDEGTGKSTLISHCLEEAPDYLKVASVSGKHDYPESFLRDIMYALDHSPAHEDVDALFNDLVNYLLEQHQEGQRSLLIIDDAEDMSADSIGLVKALSELESRESTLMRIIISSRKETAGYLALTNLIDSPDTRARLIEIEPFSERETRDYTLQLLSEDPGTANLKLTTTGGRRIHYYSGGNPQLISFLAQLTGSITLGSGQSQITRKVVQRAIRSPKWIMLSESIPGIHKVKIPGSDERGQHASPKIIVYKDGEKLSEQVLEEEKIWLGRDPSSSIQLQGASVSRRHALVTREGDTIWISNLNSINGTQVNSKPVLRRVLLDGDVIRVANYLLLFIYEEVAKSSGHLREVEAEAGTTAAATAPVLEAEPEALEPLEDIYTENYIELPETRESPITELDMDYANEPPSGTGGRKAMFAIGTIASIALVTAAIVMSQRDGEPLSAPVAPSIPPTDNVETPALPQLNMPELPAIQLEAQVIEPAVPAIPDAGILSGRPAELPMPFPIGNEQPVITPPVVEQPDFQNTAPVYQPESTFNTANTTSNPTIDSRYESGPINPDSGFADLAFLTGNTGSYATVDSYDDSRFVQNNQIADTSSFAYDDLERMIAQGNRQLAALKLTVPENDNAFATFQEVLGIDPGNAEANAGLERIADRYFALASASRDRQNFNHARNMVERGLAVQPWHQGLNDLQNEIAGQSNAVARPRIRKAGEFNIAKVPESELNSLYSNRQPVYIQPLDTGSSYIAQQPARAMPLDMPLDGFQPIFITPQAPVMAQPMPLNNYQSQTYTLAPTTTYVQPLAPVQTQPLAPIVSQPVQQVASPAPVAAPVAQQPVQQVQPLAKAPAQPVKAPVQPQQPVAVQPAPPVKTAAAIIPDYLKNGGAAAKSPTPSMQPISGQTIMSVDYLLKQANRQQEGGHYTGPTGDNALETYKRILALEPMNPDAMIGLLDIADYFYRESEKLLLLGDPLSSLAMIEQGLKVRPDHKGLRQLQTNAQLLLEKENQQRNVYGKIISTGDRKTAKIERQIDKVVSDARSRLNDQEYSQSLSLVEQGLKLDPQNAELISIRTQALKSLAELEDTWGQQEKLREQNLARQQRVKYEVNEMKAQRLLGEARKQFVQGNYQGANNAINQGLTVMPENVELMALQSEVQEAWDKQTSKNATKAVDTILNSIVSKAKQAAAAGKVDETRRLIDNGLALDPDNKDLKLLMLDIQKLDLQAKG